MNHKKYTPNTVPDVAEENLDGGTEEVATSRSGRFRVSSAPSGPPETTLGRFRLIPQG